MHIIVIIIFWVFGFYLKSPDGKIIKIISTQNTMLYKSSDNRNICYKHFKNTNLSDKRLKHKKQVASGLKF